MGKRNSGVSPYFRGSPNVAEVTKALEQKYAAPTNLALMLDEYVEHIRKGSA